MAENKTNPASGSAGKIKNRKAFPLHVFLAAIYSPLALLAFNQSQVTPEVIFRPLWISLTLGLALLVILQIFTRDWQRAGLIATLFVILFFSYGHVYNLLKGINPGGVFIFRHRTLLILWALIGAGGIWFFWRKSMPLAGITSGLNLVMLFLVIMPLFQVIVPIVRNALDGERLSWQKTTIETEAAGQSANEPDIYYIILDAHGRADILKERTGYDSSAFVASLKELGFYVGECSQTNYTLTLLSVASSLNYSYLDDLKDENGALNLQYAISQSAVRQFFEERGYKTVAFATGFRMTQLTDADYYYEPSSPKGSEFEAQLMDTTLWTAFVDAGLLPKIDMSAENYRDRTLLTLDTLKKLPNLSGPKFIFAHIASPHPPYIFDAQGNFHDVGFGEHDEKNLTPEELASLYRGQVEFIDARILEVVRTILEKSSTPPIIIIQGDHGPLVKDKDIRTPILNAYFLPKGAGQLYPSISPVNSFRVVLDEYFGQTLPLLEDISRYSIDYRTPFDYKVVPNSCVK
jgi:hypothetical protein